MFCFCKILHYILLSFRLDLVSVVEDTFSLADPPVLLTFM